MGRIIVYTTRKCRFCRHAKEVLKDHDLPFLEVHVDSHPELRDILVSLTGRKTVPQIFFNNTHVGGCDELLELESSGSLLSMARDALNDSSPLSIPLPPEDDSRSKDEEVFALDSRPFNSLVYTSRVDLDAVYFALHPISPANMGKYPPMNTGVHRRGVKTFRKSFKGKKLTQWLQDNLGANKETSQSCCQGWLDLGYLLSISTDGKTYSAKEFYRWTSDSSSHTLNMKRRWKGTARRAVELAGDLNNTLLQLEEEFFTREGIYYDGIAQSDRFKTYLEQVTELQAVDLRGLRGKEKMAFWINIYNALVIHANVVNGPPKNALQRRMFFGRMCYVINQLPFTLSDIEHGVLRGNKKAPGTFKKPWSKTNPRQFTKVSKVDARIHFTLVCGAKSCPPVSVYTPELLDKQLTWATEAFCSEEVEIDLEKSTVRLSPLFMWYRSDFGSTKTHILGWISKYMSDNADYATLMATNPPHKIRIKYSKYNWDSNGRGYDEMDVPKAHKLARSSVSISESFATTTDGVSLSQTTEEECAEMLEDILEVFYDDYESERKSSDTA